MRYSPILLALLFLALASDAAMAADACTFTPDMKDNVGQITHLFKTCAQTWEKTLSTYALRLFWLLATIEFVWCMIQLVIRNGEINEWLAELLNQVFFIGFFLFLLTHSAEWTGAIVQSFSAAADGVQQANGFSGGTNPSDIFNAGVSLAGRMLSGLSISFQSLIIIIAGFAVLISFTLMTAALILALVESYVVLSAGVLLLGFGGSRWTKDYALKIVVYAVSVGAKLFVIQLIAGLGLQIIRAWQSLPEFGDGPDAVHIELTNCYIIAGSAIVLCVLTTRVPDLIQGLLSGTSLGADSSLATTVANGLSQMATSTYGLGMAVNSAVELAREQTGNKASHVLSKTGAAIVARSAGNLAGAAAANIGNRISGRAVQGSRLGQMSQAMSREASSIREDREKQQKKATPNAPASGQTPTSGQAPGSSTTPTVPTNPLAAMMKGAVGASSAPAQGAPANPLAGMMTGANTTPSATPTAANNNTPPVSP